MFTYRVPEFPSEVSSPSILHITLPLLSKCSSCLKRTVWIVTITFFSLDLSYSLTSLTRRVDAPEHSQIYQQKCFLSLNLADIWLKFKDTLTLQNRWGYLFCFLLRNPYWPLQRPLVVPWAPVWPPLTLFNWIIDKVMTQNTGHKPPGASLWWTEDYGLVLKRCTNTKDVCSSEAGLHVEDLHQKDAWSNMKIWKDLSHKLSHKSSSQSQCSWLFL